MLVFVSFYFVTFWFTSSLFFGEIASLFDDAKRGITQCQTIDGE